MAGQRGIVALKTIRLTRTNRCGEPLPGAGNTYVSKAVVSVTDTPNLREGEALEQTNGDNEICVTYTPPTTLRDKGIALLLCGVDDYVLEFLSTVVTVDNEAGDPEGYFDTTEVDPTQAFAIETWSSVGDGAECTDTPEDDSYFDLPTTGLTAYNYSAWPAITNGRITDAIEYGAGLANVTINGVAKVAPYWGLGPYNVRIDDEGNPGRLLVPFNNKRPAYHGITYLAPPEPTPEPVALTLPTPYYGVPTP